MLNLRDKTAQEVEQLSKKLSGKFDIDYKTLKVMQIPLPKASPGPQHVQRLSVAIGEAREFSDTASRIEARWFRVSQEAAYHHSYNDREFKKAEAAFMSSEAVNMKKLALKSVEEKKAHVAANIKEIREELDILLRFKEESKGWYDYCKKVHTYIRNSQSDILTMVGILKVAIVTKQFDIDPEVTKEITGIDTSLVEREPDQIVTDSVDSPGNGVEYEDEVTSF